MPETPFLTGEKQKVYSVDWMYYVFMPVKLVVAVCVVLKFVLYLKNI